MSDRRVLAQRRNSFSFDILNQSGTVDMVVSYSTFESPGSSPPFTVAEIFLTSRKIGSDAEAICRDAAILISLCLQHGCGLDTIRNALTRNQDGSPQSLMGRVVDRVTTEAQQ
jgi:ribonucleoside-diphosphate reductase alpha chain